MSHKLDRFEAEMLVVNNKEHNTDKDLYFIR